MSEVPIGDLKIHANGGEAKTVAPQSYTELIINNPRIQSAAQKYKPEALSLVPIPFIQDICNGSSSSWGLYPRNTREATRLLELVHKGDQNELQEHLSFMLTIFEGQIEKYLPHKTIKRFKTHKLDETSSHQARKVLMVLTIYLHEVNGLRQHLKTAQKFLTKLI